MRSGDMNRGHGMGTYSFTEQGLHDRGFAQVFHDRIVPILERYEAERQGYKKKALMGMGGSGLLGAGGFGTTVADYGNAGFVVGGFGVMGVIGVRAYFEGKWKGGLGGEVLPILCEFLGEMEYGQQRIDLGAFSRVGVLPGYDSSNLEDPVTGSHDGLDWAMTEVTLKKRSRDSKGRTRTSTVFRGLLFEIQINGPAPRIYFGRDRGGMLNWISESLSSSRAGLEKIEIDDPEFENIYETYTSNPHAARQFIDANLTRGLLEVADIVSGKSYISCAMEGHSFYLALPRKGDFLGLGSLFKPLTTVENDLHDALADLTLPSRVIDKLRGR